MSQTKIHIFLIISIHFSCYLQNHNGINGKFKRRSNIGNGGATASENHDKNYNPYEQIPKELLRDLKRSNNFEQLNDDSKKQL